MRVALFVTCLVDTLFPDVGKATVRLLDGAGIETAFPREQTCCGQLHLNAGSREVARMLAERFVRVFAGYDAVVAPSGSCAGHVRTHVPELLDGADRGVPARVFELSQFLVDELGVVETGSSFTGRLTYHPTCHSLRVLRVGAAPVRLLQGVAGAEIVELPDGEACCGFGGTFAVKNADVSSAMLDEKLDKVLATGADAVCACDSSCLMHIGGGLRRRGSTVHAVHLAEVLAT